jgi:F0F1-type ATP synthase assembly protein I
MLGRAGRTTTQGVVLLVAAVAGALWYRATGIKGFEGGLLAAALPFSAFAAILLYRRAEAKLRWRAAWDAYAQWDLAQAA